MSKKLLVKQVRSSCGEPKRVKATLQTLGLGRISQEREFNADDQAVRGKLRQIRHLIFVNEK